MNDAQLNRALQSIGKECFVTYFLKFNDHLLTNQDLCEILINERGYRPSACSTRVSKSRGIIKAGCAKNALMVIAESNVDKRTRELASELAAQLED